MTFKLLSLNLNEIAQNAALKDDDRNVLLELSFQGKPAVGGEARMLFSFQLGEQLSLRWGPWSGLLFLLWNFHSTFPRTFLLFILRMIHSQKACLATFFKKLQTCATFINLLHTIWPWRTLPPSCELRREARQFFFSRNLTKRKEGVSQKSGNSLEFPLNKWNLKTFSCKSENFLLHVFLSLSLLLEKIDYFMLCWTISQTFCGALNKKKSTT